MMATNGNVLVIDDDPARAEELAGLVTSAGFHTQVVTDVNNAEFSPGINSELDVILCELDLKDVSWPEARRALRDMDVQVPAIMLCDVAEADRMMTALRLGASDFFLRPVEDKDALFRSIERCVRQRQLRRMRLRHRRSPRLISGQSQNYSFGSDPKLAEIVVLIE